MVILLQIRTSVLAFTCRHFDTFTYQNLYCHSSLQNSQAWAVCRAYFLNSLNWYKIKKMQCNVISYPLFPCYILIYIKTICHYVIYYFQINLSSVFMDWLCANCLFLTEDVKIRLIKNCVLLV